MNYIDLTLKKINSNQEIKERTTLSKVVNNTDNITVILGSAGSGKTSILNKFLKENENVTQFCTVKHFLKLNNKILENKKIILLDGLDEYRSLESDKTFVVSNLAQKLTRINTDIRIVISCREMDWYGDTDTKSLNNTLTKKVDLYQILPPSYEQKIALLQSLEVSNKKGFIEKYEKYGFLENPQMLKMLAYIDNLNTNTITTKTELYKKFIDYSLESNAEYTLNEPSPIDTSDIYKYAGYVAYYNIFCNVDKFDDNFINNITDNKKGYTKDKIQKTLSTKLFNEKKFIHRTISEFLLAQFIIDEKFSTDIIKHRIKQFFAPDNRVPTELKGAFSWLCSLSKDLEIIKIDPYYQCAQGDNSEFNDGLKKATVLEVKKQSETNPYFMNFHDGGELKGFYNPKLDKLLVEELTASLQMKNHYFLFLYSIINTKEISTFMQDFLESFAFSDSISSDNLSEIVKLINDKQLLKNILNKVRNDEILDEENRVKENILRMLYPKNITHKEVASYLSCYQKDNYSTNYSFLYETDYENKKALLDDIHNNVNLSEDLKYFFYDYLAETVSKFENELTAKDIYKIILHFRKYYNEYTHFKIESFRTPLSNWLNSNKKKIEKLANELFALYINDLLKQESENGFYRFHSFEYFFPYSPNNQTNILLNIMNEKLSMKKNTELFKTALLYLPRNTNDVIIPTKKVREKAKKLHLEDILDSWLNPRASSWNIKQETREQQENEKNEKQLKKNEAYLKNQTDEDIQKNINVLFIISKCLYFKDYNTNDVFKNSNLTKETFNRVKGVVKNAIFNPLIHSTLLTIDSLVKESTNAHRYIDTVYYISCVLNKPEEIGRINNTDFLKYLYINSLSHSTIGGIVKDNYYEYIETYRLTHAITILKEYIQLIIHTHAKNYFSIVAPYIDSEDDIGKLKEVLDCIDNKNIQTSMLSNFLNAYNLSISLGDLKKLQSQRHDNEDKITALIILLSDKEKDFTLSTAISLYQTLGFNWRDANLSEIKGNIKIRLINYLMNIFDAEKSIEFVDGIQSDRDNCASFLSGGALEKLNLDELNKLKNIRKNKTDCIWKNRIKHKIIQIEQQDADKSYLSYSVDNLKKFILSDDVVSSKDFFEDIVIKIEKLKYEIEDNRNNEKELFLNSNGSCKNEEACRDVIIQKLNDKYGDTIHSTKEKHEANNRVDINISQNSYEVQIECKKDFNPDIYKGVPEQLIKKYLSSQVEYGIYLIFYFGKRKKKDLLIKVNQSIPSEYINQIKVINIDLIK